LLVQAAEAEGYEAMEALLGLGADAKATDNRGQSALDFARAREENEKIALLSHYGVG
jgi:ankyrin repeat protein